jgi:hypothetical protein
LAKAACVHADIHLASAREHSPVYMSNVSTRTCALLMRDFIQTQ